jgi:peptidoglycan/xylan/chitin deacetylase (PgdA/CDA1 family)
MGKAAVGMRRNTISAGVLLLALALFLVCLAVFGAVSPREDAVAADAQAAVEQTPPLIALTFDDGPRPATTAQLLDGLSQRGVQATFFLIGEQLPGNEELVRRMAQEGHQIGIHTYDHVMLTGLNQTDFDAQVARTRQLLCSILGYDDFVLRPPYGLCDEGVRAMAGCPIILWSIDPEDWGDKNTQREVEQIVREARDGSIILLHDIYPTSVDAALQVIDQLHQQGFLFVTVDELFAARGVELQPGQVYRSADP